MTWNFIRLGGVDQVMFRSAADVLRLPELDQKLWLALSCPLDGVAIDRRTLELMDTDKDGRIRAGELMDAIRWLAARLEDTSGIEKRSDTIALAAVKPDLREKIAPLA